MKLVKQSAIEVDISKPHRILEQIELAARTCYKSEDKITDDSAETLIKKLIKSKHYAMLEFGYHPIIQVRAESHNPILHGYIVNTNINEPGVKYLNITHNEQKERYLISGSIRAYREFIEAYTGLYERDCILEQLQSVPYYNIFFKEYKIFNGIRYNPFQNVTLTKEDMNDVECAYHIYRHFKLTTDRGVSHELVRHRVAGFAQESTRWCNYGKDKHMQFIIPTWLNIEEGVYLGKNIGLVHNNPTNLWMLCCANDELNYNNLIKIHNWSPQQARSVLPNSLKTEINIVANIKEWAIIFEQRLSPAAHPQMRDLMEIVKLHF